MMRRIMCRIMRRKCCGLSSKRESALASNKPIDLLVVVIVSGEQVGKLAKQLVKRHFYFTRVDSNGGLNSESSVFLLVGIESSRKPALIKLIERCCTPSKRYIPIGLGSYIAQAAPTMIEAQVGGALVYTLEVEHFERL